MKVYYFIINIALCINLFCTLYSSEKIAEGIYYDHYTSIPDYTDPISVHVVSINPNYISMQLVTAHGARKRVSEFAAEHDPIIAFNAGHYIDTFNYSNYKKEWDFPSYTLKKNGAWLSDTATILSTLGWSSNNKTTFGRIRLNSFLKSSSYSFPITRINKPRFSKDAILYTPDFKQTTLTDNSGTEIIIENDVITHIYKNKGNTIIPKNGYVYSCGDESDVDISKFIIGETISVKNTIECDKEYDQEWNSCNYAVSAVPLMIYNGSIITDFKSDLCFGELYFYARHNRTAFGIKEDGTFIVVVLDGKSEKSYGMTIPELASFMKQQGCNYAINLDGGGSSTLYVKGKGIVNYPIGNHPDDTKGIERPLRDAIVIFSK